MKIMKKTLLMVAAFTLVFTLGKANVKAADYNGANGAWTTVSATADHYIGTQTNYIKFKASSTGKLVLSATDFHGYVSLCNSSKKVLAAENYGSSGCYLSAGSSYTYQQTVTFGVKKNVTYYIKLDGYGKSTSSYDNSTHIRTYTDTYSIKPVNTKVSESSGNKKAKAKTIKKGKTKKGSIAAGSSEQDWYKLKLTKSKKIKFYTNGGVNSAIKVTLYRKSGKAYNNYFYMNRAYEKNTHSTYKLPKGTYYIKVTRYKNGSGWYSLKWK